MISKKEIKRIVNKRYNKKISKKAIAKLDNLIKKEIIAIITKAARNADFSGRIVIKPNDLEDIEDIEKKSV